MRKKFRKKTCWLLLFFFLFFYFENLVDFVQGLLIFYFGLELEYKRKLLDFPFQGTKVEIRDPIIINLIKEKGNERDSSNPISLVEKVLLNKRRLMSANPYTHLVKGGGECSRVGKANCRCNM